MSDTETKEAPSDGLVSAAVPDETPQAPTTTAEAPNDDDSSSDDFDPTTIVRRRRDANAFVGDGVDLAMLRGRAAELGYSEDYDDIDDDDDDDDWESSQDEYIGLIPMLCARCVRNVRRHWFERRAKHFLVIFNVFFCVRIQQLLASYGLQHSRFTR